MLGGQENGQGAGVSSVGGGGQKYDCRTRGGGGGGEKMGRG